MALLTSVEADPHSENDERHWNAAIASLCSHSVPLLGEGLSMLVPHLPSLRYPLPDGALPVVILPQSRLSSSRSFTFVGFLAGDTQCSTVIS